MKLFYAHEGKKVRFWQFFISLAVLLILLVSILVAPIVPVRIESSYSAYKNAYDLLSMAEKQSTTDDTADRYQEYYDQLDKFFGRGVDDDIEDDVAEENDVAVEIFQEPYVELMTVPSVISSLFSLPRFISAYSKVSDINDMSSGWDVLQIAQELEEMPLDSIVSSAFSSGGAELCLSIVAGFYGGTGITTGMFNIMLLLFCVLMAIGMAISMIVTAIRTLRCFRDPDKCYEKITTKAFVSCSTTFVILFCLASYATFDTVVVFIPIVIGVGCLLHAFAAHLKQYTPEERKYLYFWQGKSLVSGVGVIIFMSASIKNLFYYDLRQLDLMMQESLDSVATRGLVFTLLDFALPLVVASLFVPLFRMACIYANPDTKIKNLYTGRNNMIKMPVFLLVIVATLFYLTASVHDKFILCDVEYQSRYITAIVGLVVILVGEIVGNVVRKKLNLPEEMETVETGRSTLAAQQAEESN